MNMIEIDMTTHPDMIGVRLTNESITNFIKNLCKITNKEEIKYHINIKTDNPVHVAPAGLITMEGEEKLDKIIRRCLNNNPDILNRVFNLRQRSYALDYAKHWICPNLATESISCMLYQDSYFRRTWTRAIAAVIFNSKKSMVYISREIPVQKLHEDFDFDLLDDGWDNDGDVYELAEEDIEYETFTPNSSYVNAINNISTGLFEWGSAKALELVEEIAQHHKASEQIVKITI